MGDNETRHLNLDPRLSAALADRLSADASGGDEEAPAELAEPSIGAPIPVSTEDAYVISGVDAALAVRLINIKTGSYELLSSHKEWLDGFVPPVIADRSNVWFDVLGFTSRVGSVSYNLSLSQQRAAYVAGYLAKYIPIERMNVFSGFGESGSWAQSDNAGYDRAVEVYVFGYKPPPAKTTSTAVRPRWRTFKVRLIAATSVGILNLDDYGLMGVSLQGYLLEFMDVARNETAYFAYSGAGLTLPTLSSSAEIAGPWSSFRLLGFGKERLADFAGPATLYQTPGVSYLVDSQGGDSRLAIDSPTLVKNGTLRNPRQLLLAGGKSLGAGLGMVSQGTLTLIPTP